MTISKEDLARRDKTGGWNFNQLAIRSEPEFFAGIANNILDPACKDIEGIEVRTKYMMQSSKEYVKANKQFKVEAMQENITVIINNRPFIAEVGYEMSDGEISDINTLFVIVDDLPWNMNYLIESLKDDIVEDITDILKGRT